MDYKSINFSYREEYIKKKELLCKELEAIESTLAEINVNDNSGLSRGSKVLCHLKDEEKEGRVLNVLKDGNLVVKVEEDKQVYRVPQAGATDLSVGTIGLLDKRRWLIIEELDLITKGLSDSDIPEVLIKFQDNIVQYIVSKNAFPFSIIEFVHASDLKTYKLKIPYGKIGPPGFYFIKMNGNKLLDICHSTEFAFKEYYKGRSESQ